MKEILGAFLFALIGILCSNNTFAQQIQKGIKFKRIEANPQLSHLDITAISQDSKGFLWVGTVDGLNRFDGYDFKIYRNIENDTASLVKNTVQSIFEDSHGTVWVSTLNSGLHYYNRASDAFYRITEFSHQNCQVLRILEDYDHNVWIAGVLDGNAFVATLDYQTNLWKKYLLFPATDGIYSMLQSSKNEFWLGSRLDGLFKWNKKTNTLQQYLHDPKNTNSLPGNFIDDIAKDPYGNLWIGTHDDGLSKFNVASNTFTNFSFNPNSTTTLSSNAILDICVDGRYLWIGTENGGLSRIDSKTNELTNYRYDKDDPTSIINNSIWSLYKDQQGRIWIGSFANGLCVLDALEDKIPTMNPSLENEVVNAIYRDSKERMWIGTEGGLFLIDKAGLHHFQNDPTNSKSISSNAVLCIFEDSKHQLWFGFWNGGINRFDENSKSFIRYLHDPNKRESLSNPNVFSIKELSKTHELLVGTFGGVNILKDDKKGIFEKPFSYPIREDQMIYSILEDYQHTLWVGARSGLSQHSLKTNNIKRINVSNDLSKVRDRINCIFEDHNKVLWIGSNGGLHRKISETNFITYTTKDGLPVNVVQGILEDSKGNLWIGTTKGLTVFNPQDTTFKTYDKSDGLLSNEFRRKAFFKAKDGQLFVGGKGVNTFYPDSITSNPNKPSVIITDFKIFNQSIKPKASDGILKDDITETKEVYLNHTQSFFSVNYVGINFTASYKNQYAYKLDGFNNDWIYVGTQRFATFTNLDPGTYTFRVKACNNDGLWNEEGASLIIHVLPPWWKTWWFRTLTATALVGLVITIFVLRTKNIRHINKILEITVNQKTKQISEQNERLIQSQEEIRTQRDLVKKQNESLEDEVAKRTLELVEYNQQLEQFAFISAHNLRAPVARILGLGHLIALPESTYEEKEQIYPKLVQTTKELDTVVKDLNAILQLKKHNDTYLTNVDLAKEIIMVRANLEHEISVTDTTITTDFSQASSITTVKPYLDSIIYNLVSNAIKYRHPNRKPIIHLKTTKIENEVCLSVTDNGLGVDVNLFKEKMFTLYSRFHEHVEGKGMGLYLVKTQMTALGGRIEVESKVDKGTTFRAFFKA